MNGRVVLLTIILLGCTAPVMQKASSATVTPATGPVTDTQQSRGVNYYLQRPDKRSAMIGRCDRAHGQLTTLHLPGESPLNCESAISALAKIYAVNGAALNDMLHRCEARRDERELFSECRAVNLAQHGART